LCPDRNVIVVTLGGYFSSAKVPNRPADKGLHFRERLVCGGSGAIPYLD